MIADALPARPAERTQLDLPRRLRRRRAAILDLDGTLVDSNEAHALSWLVAFHDFGHDVALELVRPLVGMAPARIIYHAVGAPRDVEAARGILQRQSQIFRTWYLPRLLPFVGTRALLQRMRREGLRLIAATAAPRGEALELVEASGINDLLDDIVTGHDVENWPDADVVATALAKSMCAPESVVMLGDTPYDVSAGARVGVDVVALRCGGWRDAALRGAVAIYTDAADLLRNYSTSPFFSPATTLPYTAPRLSLVQ
jgi:phosphoglycolate phosphatase-like HAD superfamily hydrolase